MDGSRLLTYDEAAAELRVHRSTVKRLVASGTIAVERHGHRTVRIARTALLEYRRRATVAARVPAEEPTPIRGRRSRGQQDEINPLTNLPYGQEAEYAAQHPLPRSAEAVR